MNTDTPRTDALYSSLHPSMNMNAAHQIVMGHARQLERENAELLRDKERLDWMDKNCTRIADSERYLPTTVYWGKGTHKDIRTAIDAAMKGQP